MIEPSSIYRDAECIDDSMEFAVAEIELVRTEQRHDPLRGPSHDNRQHSGGRGDIGGHVISMEQLEGNIQ